MALPGWYSFSSVVDNHATLEGIAVAFFVALVVFDVLAHLNKKQELAFERIALVCFGIAVLAEVAAYPYSRRMDALSKVANVENDARMAALNKEAGDARKEAGDAVERASKADERASKNEKEAARLRKQAEGLKKSAEDERLARVKIEERIADRVLTPEQRSKFASALAGKSKFTIILDSEDGEPARYGRQFVSVFAGWDVNSGGLGITTILLDPKVAEAIEAQLPGGVPIITFGPRSNRANVRVLGEAFFAAGIKHAEVDMTQQAGDEIRIYFPPKVPK